MPGLYYEEFQPGQIFDHATRRTMTEMDNVLMCALTANPQPLCIDAEYAKGTVFGQRLVNGLFVFGFVAGVPVPDMTLGTTLGNLGFEDVKFTKPVFIGDTVRARTEITAKRESKKRSDSGIVFFRHYGINQRDEIVLQADRAGLMLKVPAGLDRSGVNPPAPSVGYQSPARSVSGTGTAKVESAKSQAAGPLNQEKNATGGLHFEDCREGLVIEHAIHRTVTETDNLMFSAMTYNCAPLHIDAEYSKGSIFGQRLVNSMYLIGLVSGITVIETTLGTTLANVGYEDIQFPKPVFHGDTIRVRTEIVKARPSKSRSDCGVVTFRHVGINQRGEEVCIALRTGLMLLRPKH